MIGACQRLQGAQNLPRVRRAAPLPSPSGCFHEKPSCTNQTATSDRLRPQKTIKTESSSKRLAVQLLLRVHRSVGSDASVIQNEPNVSKTPQQPNHLRPFPSVSNSGVRHSHGVGFWPRPDGAASGSSQANISLS